PFPDHRRDRTAPCRSWEEWCAIAWPCSERSVPGLQDRPVLPERLLADDLAVREGEEVAAFRLDAAAVGRRAAEGPFGDTPVAGRKMAVIDPFGIRHRRPDAAEGFGDRPGALDAVAVDVR